MLKRLVPLIIIISFVIGCKNNSKIEYTYFGGKIIHPKDSIVILTGNNGFRDTLELCSDNTFMGRFRDFRSGLYYFRHGVEHQYAYIKAKDSLIFRLNTWEFDESLVFSGKNAENNNLLIEAFLQSEEDERIISKEGMASTMSFINTTDHLLNLKKEKLEDYKTSHINASKEFLDVYEIALTFPIYSELEKYTINNCTRFKSDTIKEKLLKHRNGIQLRRDSLLFYAPYYTYVMQKMYSEAMLKGYTDESEEFVIDILNRINEEVSDEEIKNRILYRTIAYNFMKRKRENNYQKAFFNYFKYSSDIEHKKEIQRLINDVKYVDRKEQLPDFLMEAPTGNWVSVKEVVKRKNSIVFFNNAEYFSDYSVSKRFNFLQKRFPDVNFMLIQQNKGNSDMYVKGIDIKYQYKLIEESKAHNFLTSEFPRLMIVDKKGVVLNDFSSIFAFDIESQIQELLKK
ncbi:hypothetical protein SAMN04489761_1083 [Tenacibaculum sp. MAR_2009_124]|uniref:hypothetical protein n=1 Tax=Tenacibaculum sp. MAR_2009_124 TaxID=1250059 RepID=UPI000898013E|nr:hypothetical protein [Tenacibaculum sp. MAR_2009_124]SEB50319.1 hypothetical protein SAMN04489761_1083 [Tenacibaculum sp. MAR_2009_124]